MSYIGSTPTTQSFIAGTDYFNGTGSQTAFTLSRSVVSVNDIEVVVNNVVQQPNSAYTISGTTITFTGAPSAGTSNIYVRYLSTTTQSITPSQGTVSYQSFNADNQSKLGISFKNRIINGAMVIDQRNAGSAVTIDGTTNTYTLDRWMGIDVSSGSFTVQQDSTAPVGFVNSSKLTVASTVTSYATTDSCQFMQRIEGYNLADLGWGTANAKTVTLSFWVRSSLTGTFGGAIKNSASTRSYPYSYTISAADTWEQKTITIAGDTTGTWLTTNGIGAMVIFCLGGGTDRLGTAGAWNANNNVGATGQVNVMGTLSATFYITGVQLEVGTQATTFDYRSYGTELQLCQRYFEVYVSGGNNTGIMSMVTGSSTTGRGTYIQKVQKRANPSSVTFLSGGSYLYQGAGINATLSAISVAVSSPSAVLVDVTISGATAGQPANLLENSAAGTNSISISAEL